MTKQVKVLNCFFNDWLGHPGWWAQMYDPDMKAGDEFEFTFAHRGPLKCRAIKILRPGEPKPGADTDEAKRFVSWWVIQYKELEVNNDG